MEDNAIKETPLFSLICVYNNVKVMSDNIGICVREAINRDFEKIFIDNSASKYDSAAKSLNVAARQSKGKYLIFMHQDVKVLDNSWLDGICEYFYKIPDIGVAGCAGINGLGEKAGFIIDRNAIWGKPLKNPVEVQSLDEVMLIVERDAFNAINGFDEKLGGWHCYGADLCMRMSVNGKKNYVLPLFIHHRSLSTNLYRLIDIQRNLRRKFKSGLHITTAGGISQLDLMVARLKVKMRAIKIPLIRILSFVGLGTEENILSSKLRKHTNFVVLDYYKEEYRKSYPKKFEFNKFSNNPAWKRQQITYYFLDDNDAKNIASIEKKISANIMIVTRDLKGRIPSQLIGKKLSNSYYYLEGLKPAKILFLVPEDEAGAASVRMRVGQFIGEFNKFNISCKVEPFVNKRFQKILFSKGAVVQLKKLTFFILATGRRIRILFETINYDLVFVHRHIFPFGPAVFEYIIKSVFRKKIIYDFDDAIFLPVKTEANSSIAALKFNAIKIRQIIQLSDRVIAGNNYLREFALRYNKNVIVIPTVIETVKYTESILSKQRNKLVIGWIGSHGTTQYLSEYLDVFMELAEKYNNLEFNFIGYQGQVDHPQFKIYSWSQSEEISLIKQFDIGINPLPDNSFTRGKCGFKIIQYMAAAIPSVVSPVGANRDIVVDGETGYFAKTRAEWFEKLSILSDNKDLRKRMGNAARERAKGKYDVSIAFSQLKGVMESCLK